MPLTLLLEALGGLGLFVLGMKTMSEGLQRLAGERLRRSLERVTGNRLTAALMGSCLTTLLQSSGAASIIVIGFVNAGLLSLYQALAMLLGTGVGTTLVVQLISFKISFLASPGIAAGVFLKFFGRRRRWVHLGEVLLGLGLLFLGLQVMEINFSPLKESAFFTGFQARFTSWHLFGVLLGALLSFFVQSGSAAVGIVIALAGGGLLRPEPAVAMVVGEFIGTSWLAAIGAINGTGAARRTVLLYAVISLFTVTLALILFPLYLKLVLLFSPHGTDMASIDPSLVSRMLANAHTVLSVGEALLFLPLIGFFARSAAGILPGPDRGGVDMEPRIKYIDLRVINTPSIAFLQARRELERMAGIARNMFRDTLQLFDGYSARKASLVVRTENVLDALQKDISNFLVTLARQSLTPEIAMGIPSMLRMVNDLEGMGDNTETILECLRRKKEGNVYFSHAAMEEIRVMGERVGAMLDLAVASFSDPDRAMAEEAETGREAIRAMRDGLNENHINRLSSGACTVTAGLLYIDIISAFARISDQAMEVIKAEGGVR